MTSPEHLEVVVFAVRFLLDLHPKLALIGEDEIEKSLAVAMALYPSINADKLRRDVAFVLETVGEALYERQKQRAPRRNCSRRFALNPT